MYGTQAMQADITEDTMFENDVKMYGTQAITKSGRSWRSLRMM